MVGLPEARAPLSGMSGPVSPSSGKNRVARAFNDGSDAHNDGVSLIAGAAATEVRERTPFARIAR